MRYSLAEKQIPSQCFLSNKEILYIVLQPVLHKHYTLIYFSVYQSVFPFVYPTQHAQVQTQCSGVYARGQNELSLCTQNAQPCLNVSYYPVTGNTWFKDIQTRKQM